jgi:alkylated DNA nucleotide flippase Atl1
MAAVPKGLGVPWHRVVGAGGRLLIREPLASLQRRLLQNERTIFSGYYVDINVSGWVPKRKQREKRAKRDRNNVPARSRR